MLFPLASRRPRGTEIKPMAKVRHSSGKGPNTGGRHLLDRHAPSLARISCSDFDDQEEAEFLRNVWEPTGAALRLREIETALMLAGYSIRKTEVSPHKPPMVAFHLARKTAPRLPDQDQFFQHIRQILESVGVDVRKANLAAEQRGNKALVAFILRLVASRRV